MPVTTNDLVPASLAKLMAERKRLAVPWTPHNYQEWALEFELGNPFGGLLLDPEPRYCRNPIPNTCSSSSCPGPGSRHPQDSAPHSRSHPLHLSRE